MNKIFWEVRCCEESSLILFRCFLKLFVKSIKSLTPCVSVLISETVDRALKVKQEGLIGIVLHLNRFI